MGSHGQVAPEGERVQLCVQPQVAAGQHGDG